MATLAAAESRTNVRKQTRATTVRAVLMAFLPCFYRAAGLYEPALAAVNR
jgi:hypothetical protein